MGEEARDYEDTEKRTREPKGWRAEMDSALMSVLLRRSTSSSEVLRSGVERGEKGDGERRREEHAGVTDVVVANVQSFQTSVSHEQRQKVLQSDIPNTVVVEIKGLDKRSRKE